MPWLVVVFPVITSVRVSVVTSMNLPRIASQLSRSSSSSHK